MLGKRLKLLHRSHMSDHNPHIGSSPYWRIVHRDRCILPVRLEMEWYHSICILCNPPYFVLYTTSTWHSIYSRWFDYSWCLLPNNTHLRKCPCIGCSWEPYSCQHKSSNWSRMNHHMMNNYCCIANILDLSLGNKHRGTMGIQVYTMRNHRLKIGSCMRRKGRHPDIGCYIGFYLLHIHCSYHNLIRCNWNSCYDRKNIRARLRLHSHSIHQGIHLSNIHQYQ